jgi:hypothetical protein
MNNTFVFKERENGTLTVNSVLALFNESGTAFQKVKITAYKHSFIEVVSYDIPLYHILSTEDGDAVSSRSFLSDSAILTRKQFCYSENQVDTRLWLINVHN